MSLKNDSKKVTPSSSSGSGNATSKSQKAREELLHYLAQKNSSDQTKKNSNVKDKRKLVRILHNHHIAEEDILNELQQNESDYLERISSLKSYQSMTKQSQKQQLYQTEWKDEQLRLQNLLYKLEHQMNDVFQSVLLGDVSMSGGTMIVTELLGMKEQTQSSRQGMKAIYHSQLKELQNLVKDYSFTVSKNVADNTSPKKDQKGKEGGDYEQEEENEDQKLLVSSIFADLLMKLRMDFQSKSIELEKEEEKLEKEVKQCYHSIQQMLHQDILQQQNQQLQENLLSIFAEIDVKDILEFNKSINELDLRLPTGAIPRPTARDSEKANNLPLSVEVGKTSPSLSIKPNELVETFLVLNTPRKDGSQTNRSKATPRSISPSQQLKTTVLDIIHTFSATNSSNGDPSVEKEKLQLLLEDPDIAPIVYQYLYQIYTIDQEHQQTVEQKQQEKHQFCEEIGITTTHQTSENAEASSSLYEDLEGSGSEAPTPRNQPTATVTSSSQPYGNLPCKVAHDIFVKIYRKAEVTGMLRKTMLEILMKELSSFAINMDDLLLHEEWYRKMKFIQQKYKTIEQQYLTQRKEVIQTMKQEIRNAIQEKKESILHQQHLIELHAKRQVLYEQLQQMKAQRDAKDQSESFELLQKQQEMQEVQFQKDLLLQKEREYKKQLLYDYYQQKKQSEMKQKQLQDQQKTEEMNKIKELIDQNRSKVQFRQQKIEEKRLQKKLMEEQALEEEKRKIELLNKLAEQAPYWSIIKDIAPRLDHATVSSLAQAFIPREEGDELTRGHIPMNGFTDHKVIRDTRFRIVEALRMAGLANTQAAKEVVAQYHPRPHLAIHGILNH